MKKFACLFLVLAASGCPNIDTDPGEEDATGDVVEFDPANSIVPFPNNLLLDATTGKVALPRSCGETPASTATREGVINKLDGFGTFEGANSVTFSAEVDMASLEGKIVMYKIAAAGMPVDPGTSMPIPTRAIKGTTTRFDVSCANPTTVQSLTIVPLVPLDGKSTYAVGLLKGISSASGSEFGPSTTWGIVRSAENPVTIENGVIVSDRTPLDPTKPADALQLNGIDLLWRVHSGPLAFLAAKSHARKDVLLAWSFNTQTTTDPLDPAVAGSPASAVGTTPLAPVAGINAVPLVFGMTVGAGNYAACPPQTDESNALCFLKINLGLGAVGIPSPTPAQIYAAGSAVCSAVGCAAVGDILRVNVSSKSYQVESPNPVTGTCMPPGDQLGCPIPGPWSDPVKPAVVKTALIPAFAIVPAVCPVDGCKTVVFQHGLGQSKSNIFAIGPQLAANAGSISIGIDAVAHGERAFKNTVDPARGCAATSTSPANAPQCYSPFLSANLGTTRDNIRQTTLDQLSLIAGLKACGVSGCAGLSVNGASLTYIGQSLGGIIGSTTTAVSSDLKSSVLNVPGVGWADIFENTASLSIRCSLVDNLIDAGILTGAKYVPAAGGNPATGLCTTDAWKAQPGYRQFSLIGRWILDPADPANFTKKLAQKKYLIQQVDGDQVVPNLATKNEAALVGKATPANADCAASQTPAASAAITTDPTSSKYVLYRTLPPGTGCAAGATFDHGSLLRPTPPPVTNPPTPTALAATLGTIQMQIDALTFMLTNR